MTTTDTVDAFLRAHAGDAGVALRFDDDSWTWPEATAAAAQRAALLLAERRPGPLHIGVLADNVPEYVHWLSAAALAGATVVGINPTRRGAELARDITHTDCQVLIVDPAYADLLDGLDLGDELGPDRVWRFDDPAYHERLAAHAGADLATVDAALADEGRTVGPDDLYLLLFTSGTSGAPKAVKCSQGRLARIAGIVAMGFGLGADSACYLSMPLFHSNALMAGWCPAVAGGATSVLRRKFSASAFLSDVRRYGVTYANYVGKPLAYILATPEQPDDADNPLRIVFGNEASDGDIAEFGRRFGCVVIDGYGSSEGGASVSRTPDTPPGSLGPAGPDNLVLDPETGDECPVAQFDAEGALQNADEAIGELVSRSGGAQFEGYWRNEEAEAERRRGDNTYWTGDLAYKDADGFLYFAGRSSEWLRVDGENLAVAPIERILQRHPDVAMAAVYAVPDPVVGDQCMAALVLRSGATFDPEGFAAFLAEQADLGTKSAPRLVRIVDALPTTQTNKVLKRQLQQEAADVADPVWHRPGKPLTYEPLER
ncbi:MAG: AMP-binding protein [Acidimicrobiales bacterium]|nr:AMP-binding protein [Acidimicrobiales bacterium]